jgi:F-box interacting protein
MYGLGYDSFSNDYKVLVLTYRCIEYRRFDRVIHVYSVNSGAWKGGATARVCSAADHVGACVNGAIHAFIETDDAAYVIEAFNLADGGFHKIPAPPNNRTVLSTCYNLRVLNGCLCVVSRILDRNIEIQMMKQYGGAGSWTKITIVTDGQWGIRRPICFIGDREIVCLTFRGQLVVYNLRKRTMEFLLADGVPTACRDAVAFVDGLVSPRRMMNSSEME